MTAKTTVTVGAVKPAGKPAVEYGKPAAVSVITDKSSSEVEVVTRQEIEVKRMVGDIISATVAVGEKYLTLAKYIRENQVTKANATRWMIDMGMHKSKASEVCRVSMADNKSWSEFEAKSMGWRGILQITRGNLDEMKRVNPAIVPPELVKEVTAELVKDEEASQAEENKYANMSEEEIAKAKAEDKRAAWKERMERAAVSILTCAELTAAKARKWSIANGYVLKLEKAPKPVLTAGPDGKLVAKGGG